MYGPLQVMGSPAKIPNFTNRTVQEIKMARSVTYTSAYAVAV